MYSKEVIEMITQGFKKTFPAISYQNVMELAEYIEFVEVPKKTEIIKSGQYYGKIVFVISGLFRAYYKYQETENTFWFREEYTVFASHRSIIGNKPSSIAYQALEDSVVGVIDYSLLKEFADKDVASAKSINVVLEGLMLELIERIEDFITLNPEQRYDCFLEKHHNIVNRVPQQYIASFIGIAPESLSRLKSRKMTK
jgi:CRP-like cAMP-binding protein